MTTLELGLLIFTVVSFVWDLLVRKIPNMLVIVGCLGAAVLHVIADGGGLAVPLLGGLAGLGFALPLYLFGAIGAGDVKWFGAAGAFTGPAGAGMLVLASVLAGGGAGLCLMAASAAFRQRCLELAAGWYVRLGWERLNVPLDGGGIKFPFLFCAGPVVIGFVFLK